MTTPDIQQYAALVRQQQEHPSQWGALEQEKKVLARRISGFPDAAFGELRASRMHTPIAPRVPFWLCAGLVLAFIVSLALLMAAGV